jgi:hypothetical protein
MRLPRKLAAYLAGGCITAMLAAQRLQRLAAAMEASHDCKQQL